MNQNYTSAPATPLIFTSPVFNQSISDTATLVQTSTAQGDPYVTPVTRIVSSDAGVNDTAPLYTYHNCNYTAANSAAPCVGAFMVSQNNPGDLHNGVWGINPIAIQRHGSTNSLTYGVEANIFNETGLDPGPPGKASPATSQIFGIAATIAGNATGVTHGTSAFLATDENSGSYWYDGLWVERAIYAALEAGPVGGGSDLQWSVVSNAIGRAGPHANFPSIPQADIESWWDGHASVLEVFKRQFMPTRRAPLGCYNYTFSTALRQQFCDDGSNVFLPASERRCHPHHSRCQWRSRRRGLRHQRSQQRLYLPRPEKRRHHHRQLAHRQQHRAGRFLPGGTAYSSPSEPRWLPRLRAQRSDQRWHRNRAETCPNTIPQATSPTAVSPPLNFPSLLRKPPQDTSPASRPLGPPVQIGSCSTRPDATGACSCN